MAPPQPTSLRARPGRARRTWGEEQQGCSQAAAGCTDATAWSAVSTAPVPLPPTRRPPLSSPGPHRGLRGDGAPHEDPLTVWATATLGMSQLRDPGWAGPQHVARTGRRCQRWASRSGPAPGRAQDVPRVRGPRGWGCCAGRRMWPSSIWEASVPRLDRRPAGMLIWPHQWGSLKGAKRTLKP